MRLLIDQGISPVVAERCREAGWDAVHTAERGWAHASDQELLDIALAEKRVVVTLDHDFPALLALSRAEGPSVMLIRIAGLQGKELAAVLLGLDVKVWQSLEEGAVVSMTSKNIRVHRLPLK